MKLRNILIALAVLVVLIGGALAIALGNVDRFRPRIQAELQDKLNRPVTLGQLGLKLLPLQIKVDGLSIGENPAFSSDRPFATASTVFISASLLSLLRGSPEVQTLVLDKPQIELIKNSRGVWNFSSLGQNGAGANASGGSGGNSSFSLGLLKINDGQIAYTDQSKKLPRSVYDHIDLKLSDFAPNKQFGLDLGVHFPGEGRQMAEFTGKVGPLPSASSNTPETELPPVNGHLSISQVSLAGVNRFAAGTIPDDTDGVASGEADIVTSENGVLGCKGNLKLENSTIKGSKIDYPITANYDVQDDSKQRKLLLRSGVLQLGPTSFTASGNVDMAPATPVLNLQMKTSNSSVTELAKLAGALGLGFSPDYKVSGQLSADVTAKGSAKSPQFSGSIIAKSLQASGGEIKQPVDIPEIDLNLTPDTIMSNTFTAKSGSTALSVAFTVSQYADWNTAIDATVKTEGTADIAELLNIAKAYGVTPGGASGAGKLSLDVHIKGPTANPSAIAYAGNANISSATFSTPELTKPINISSAEAQFSQNSVSLSNLAASVGTTTVKGSLSARNFSAPQVTFALSADKIDADELERLPAPTPPSAVKKTKQAKEKPKAGMLQMISGSGTLSAGEIKASDILLKDVNAKCQLDRGVIQFSPLSAEVFNGRASGSLSADMRPATPQLSSKLKFSNVDANSLLSAVSSMKNTVTGALSGNTDLRFALTSSNDLARTLNGVVSFELENGVIRNINLINEVEKVGKFLKSAGGDSSSSDGGTAIKKFSGTLNILNGVATTNNLIGVLNAGTITGQGTLNLATQDINMKLNTVLGNSLSQSVGGSGIGGYMSTALANSKGELVVPVMVTGNMSKPVVKPDMGAVAKMKLNGLIPGGGGSVASKATGILGGLLGGGQQQSSGDAKQTQQQQNPLGSILDQFKKKKPEKPQQ